MLIYWSDQAREDLLQIFDFISEHNLQAAFDLYDSIQNSVLHLSQYPHLYRQSQRKIGWREIVVHPNYIVFYRVNTRVEVMAVVHTRRDYP